MQAFTSQSSIHSIHPFPATRKTAEQKRNANTNDKNNASCLRSLVLVQHATAFNSAVHKQNTNKWQLPGPDSAAIPGTTQRRFLKQTHSRYHQPFAPFAWIWRLQWRASSLTSFEVHFDTNSCRHYYSNCCCCCLLGLRLDSDSHLRYCRRPSRQTPCLESKGRGRRATTQGRGDCCGVGSASSSSSCATVVVLQPGLVPTNAITISCQKLTNYPILETKSALTETRTCANCARMKL